MLPDQPVSTGGDASVVAEVETPVAETQEVIETPTEEVADAPKEQPKQLDPVEELEKLRKAKARDDRRIGKITAVKYQLQKEAEELRKRLSEYEANKSGSENSGEPKESDFEGRPWGDYVKALNKWNVEQALSERDKKSSEETRKNQDSDYIREREEIMDDNGIKAAKDFHDFNSVIAENSSEIHEMAPHVKRAFLDADNGAYALYALAKEGKLEELNGLHPNKVNQIIGKMEDKALASLKSKPVSKAPTPMKPNSGSGSATKEITASSNPKEILKWVYSANN